MNKKNRMTKRLAKSKDKLTWDMVFEDFKFRYPKLVKDVTLWFAYDVGQIEIHLIGGMELIYDYDLHRAMIRSVGDID